MGQETTLKPDVTLDLTGLTCPAPLLGAKQVLDDLKPGQVLALVSDCPGTRGDLAIWAKHTGNELIDVVHERGKRNLYYLRKGKGTRPEAHVTLDMRGVICPGPIVEARRVLEGMKPGEVLRLVSNCPAARDEVRTWASVTRLSLVEMHEMGGGAWEFFLKRG